ADFRRMLAAASAWLDQHADAIDAINVFPVPDGDTGRNMAQTLRAAWEAVGAEPAEGIGDVLRAAADGALLGARGNSGVILSQWMRGLAQGVEGHQEASTGVLADALGRASTRAYAAIEEPREGTILSVTRAAATCGPNPDAFTPWEALRGAVMRAEEAVARTPEQMPLLAEAGVVDSGAQGLAVVLAGFERGLREDDLPAPAADFGQIRTEWLVGASPRTETGGGFGFCTEFVLSGAGLDLEELRETLDALGDSLVVAGDERLARIHIHTDTPEAAFDAGRRFGDVDQCTTDDMDERHAELARRADAAATAAVAAVAVASGDGFARLFRELGASIVPGGATLNPSAAEILAAARASGAGTVLVLPNDRNVISAARQAADLAGAEGPALQDVPTECQPAAGTAQTAWDRGSGGGQPAAVTALSPWDRASGGEEAAERMAEAAGSVLSGGVTFAARTIDRPIALREGQPFAILGREMLAASATPEEALLALIPHMLDRWPAEQRGPAELLTLYLGERDAGPDDLPADTAEEWLHARVPALADAGVELEVVIGGQPHYPFLVSLE
ncbi:MAG: DAK2 domain-containing protein, partial [Chloroflexi bacterium]|nr:DAK2 domain-containing protein [Chloroflexota bacterium]